MVQAWNFLQRDSAGLECSFVQERSANIAIFEWAAQEQNYIDFRMSVLYALETQSVLYKSTKELIWVVLLE
jgi:hypothetical protein